MAKSMDMNENTAKMKDNGGSATTFGENPTKYSAGKEGAPKSCKIIMGGTIEAHSLQHSEYDKGGV